MVDVASRVRLVVDSTGLDRTGRRLDTFRRKARQTENSIERLGRAFQSLISVVGGGFAVASLARVADDFTEISNRLRLVTADTGDLNRTLEALGGIARSSQSDLQSTVTLFSRIEQFAGTAFESQQQALDFTGAIQNAFLAAGASAQEASNAVRQLTQGLASGELRGEEFRSVSEQAPLLARAITEAIGDGTQSAFELARQGAFTTERVVEAVLGRLEEFGRAAADIAPTIGRSLQVLRNEFTLAFGDELARAGEGVARVILLIADNLENLQPIIEGVTAGLAAFAGVATVASFGKLLSFLGLLNPAILAVVAGVSTLVAFRDEIAGFLTGVNNAGSVLTATFQVLAEKLSEFTNSGFFQTFLNVLTAFANEATKVVREWVGQSIGFLQEFAEAIGIVLDIFLDARRRIARSLNNNELERLQREQRALTDEIIRLTNDPLADADGLANLRRELDAVNELLVLASNNANELFDPSVDDRLQDKIAQLGQEIVITARELGDGGQAVKNFGNTVDRASKQVDQLTESIDGVEGALSGLRRQNTDLRILAENSFISPEEFDRLQEALDIERELERLRSQFGEGGTREARALLEEQAQLERIIDRNQTVSRDLSSIARDFADDLFNETSQAFKNLAQNATRFFQDLFISPFADALSDAVSEALSDSGLLDGFRDAVRGIFRTGGGSGQGAPGGGSQTGFGQVIGDGLLAAGLAVAGQQTGASLASLFGLGQGSTASSALQGALSGAGFGAAIAGPIGAAIGAVIGTITGVIQGILGNRTGVADFDLSAQERTFLQDSKRDAVNQIRDQLLNDSVSALNQIVDTLGGTFTPGVALNIFARSNEQGVSLVDPDTRQLLTPVLRREAGDDAGVIADAIRLVLENAVEGADEALLQFTLSLAEAEKSVEQITTALDGLRSIEQIGQQPIPQFVQALNELNDIFNDSIAAANGVVEAEQALIDARESAIERLQNEFLARLAEIEFAASDSVLSGFRQVALDNASILLEDEALFGDTTRSSNARIANFENFFLTLLDSGTSIVAINDQFAEFQRIAEEAGASLEALGFGLERAVIRAREAFDTQVQDDIGRFLDGPLDRLEQLLQSQADRLQRAEQLGADIAQVQRLTALEQREFFESLSESAIEEVQDFLGLFVDASNTVRENFDLSRQDLRAVVDAFRQFAQDFAQLNNDLTERFIAASPRESLDILRGRAVELLRQVGIGNESAAQALPQVINDLVQNARDTFGNTQSFQEVLAFAQETLTAAEQSALQVVSDAERQIAVLDEQLDVLQDIKDILEDAQAINALLLSSATGGIASSDELLRLIQQGTGVTGFAANDNASTLSIINIVTQSLAPVFTPIVDSIGIFTERLSSLPNLQQLTIEAIDRGSEQVAGEVEALDERMDRIEVLNQKMLAELETLNSTREAA